MPESSSEFLARVLAAINNYEEAAADPARTVDVSKLPEYGKMLKLLTSKAMITAVPEVIELANLARECTRRDSPMRRRNLSKVVKRFYGQPSRAEAREKRAAAMAAKRNKQEANDAAKEAKKAAEKAEKDARRERRAKENAARTKRLKTPEI